MRWVVIAADHWSCSAGRRVAANCYSCVMKHIHLTGLVLLLLTGCQTMQRLESPRAASSRSTAGSAVAWAPGTFDNHEQVWSGHLTVSGAPATPHVVVAIESTSQEEWSIWRVRLDATPPVDAVWAMQTRTDSKGSITLRPFRSSVAIPGSGSAFEPKQWSPLDACTLRGKATAGGSIDVAASAAACATIAPEIGVAVATLPLSVRYANPWMRVRLYADQARGGEAHENARLVRLFTGWAAINGSGPDGAGRGNDWHMNPNIRIENEGGRSELVWRDGKPSGYSLELERVTYRDGNVPVLKLSVIEDASGQTLGYAWANPQATRIGINLGWVQVGLENVTDSAAATPLEQPPSHPTTTAHP